jgi:hypothetical protein
MPGQQTHFHYKPTLPARLLSKFAAVGIRLERLVGWHRRIEATANCTTNFTIRFTFADRPSMNEKPTLINGALCRRCGHGEVQLPQNNVGKLTND